MAVTEKELYTRIQLKYDSLANWTTNGHVVLKKGEIGICAIGTDDVNVHALTGKQPPEILFKVGDGVSTFSALPWASAKASDVYGWAKQATLPIVRASSETGDAGNVIGSIKWNATEGKIEYTTANVATAEGMKAVADDLDTLEAAVAAMYTNAKIDELVADAKAEGTNAKTALENYQSANDAAVLANTNAIAAINDKDTGILVTAKNYADGLNKAMDARVKAYEDVKDSYAKSADVANTYATKDSVATLQSNLEGEIDTNAAAIAAINHADTGILAKAKEYSDDLNEAMDGRVKTLEDEKVSYAKAADVVSNTTFAAFEAENTKNISDAEARAKAHADAIKKEILTGDSAEELDKTYDTLLEIQNWMKGEGVDATELTDAIAVEAKTRGDADTALGERIDGVVSAYEAADKALAADIAKFVSGDTAVKNAENATKATQDANGNVITETYATKAALTAAVTNLEKYADQAEADALDAAKSYADGLSSELAGADEALSGRLYTVEGYFNDGKAKEAAKVSNKLTITKEDASVVEYDGSEAKAIDLTGLATKTYADQAEADAKKYADDEIAKVVSDYEAADTALDGRLNTIESSYLTDVTVGTGLTVSNSPDVHGRKIEIDDTVVFVFNCGSASELTD